MSKTSAHGYPEASPFDAAEDGRENQTEAAEPSHSPVCLWCGGSHRQQYGERGASQTACINYLRGLIEELANTPNMNCGPESNPDADA